MSGSPGADELHLSEEEEESLLGQLWDMLGASDDVGSSGAGTAGRGSFAPGLTLTSPDGSGGPIDTSGMGPLEFGQAFIAAVDWTEPWLMALLAFHVVCFVLVIVTRRRTGAQIALFLVLAALVLGAQTLNELAAQNWRRFATQQYFDAQGMFTAIVFCLPILINCVVMLVLLISNTFTLLVKAKQAKARAQARRSQKASSQKDQPPAAADNAHAKQD